MMTELKVLVAAERVCRRIQGYLAHKKQRFHRGHRGTSLIRNTPGLTRTRSQMMTELKILVAAERVCPNLGR